MTFPSTLNIRPAGPIIERVRYEMKMRQIEVAGVQRLTPSMIRIVFCGDDLVDFPSLGFDDHVKLFAPTLAGDIVRRDYTPRRYDREACTLTLDFAVHDAGPATSWALQARPGDRLQIGGPKGSAMVSPEVRHWVLVGDETALPAIGRHIENAAADASVTSVVAVAGPQEEQVFETRATLTTLWAHRPLTAAADAGTLLARLDEVKLRPQTFVWIAAEATVARAVRTYLAAVRTYL